MSTLGILDIKTIRKIERVAAIKGAGDRDSQKGTWLRASRHINQQVRPGIDIRGSEAVEGGGRAERTSDGDEEEGAWGEAYGHPNQHA